MRKMLTVALTAGMMSAFAVPAAVMAQEPSTWDKIEGNWTEMQGKVKEQWGSLTDDDLMEMQGQRQQLVGKLQARYGISLEEAEAQVTDWENKVAE